MTNVTCHACGSPTTRDEVRSKSFYFNACTNKDCEWSKAQTHWDYEHPVFKEWTPFGKANVDMSILEMEVFYSQQ